MDLLLKTICVGGHLIVYPDKVTIEMKGWGVHNVKSLDAYQITGVDVKTTYAKVLFSQGAATVTVYATGDQKLVAKLVKLADAQKAEELINDMIRKKSTAGRSGGVDELEKLADLKKKGIITDAEFEAKKKQILGL